MPRDHTRVNLGIWGDDEFLDLPVDAQSLYWRLWTSPDRTYCGSHEWRPGKLAQSAEDWTVERLRAAAAVLSERLFLIVDEDTEECLLRSWIKHDGLWKQPNMAVSMANARSGLGSKILKGVVVHEVKKLAAAEPGLDGWKRESVKNLLTQKAIDPASLIPFSPGPKGGVNPPPTTSTATSTSTSTKGSYVSRERHLVAVPDSNPPSPRCSDHRDLPNPPACGGCADARRIRADWDIAQAVARAQAILDCPDCDDETGFVLINAETDTWKRCDHPKLRREVS